MGFEFLGQVFRRPAGMDQVNHLLPEGSGIRRSSLGHDGYPLRFKIAGVQKNGSSPIRLSVSPLSTLHKKRDSAC
ncbi:protein of unknown function (plasmid) [Cupriavidus taiwanensis]|nr:protein of unknown function [Cupriavidus taiwanensis]